MKNILNRWFNSIAIFFLYLISLLPLNILYQFSNVVYFILYYIIKYRKHVILPNLINSFPDKSTAELKQIEKKFYCYMADLFVECIKMISVSPDYIYKRFSFKNLEVLRRLEDENRNYIMAVGHYGNWEWCTIVTPMITTAKPLIVYKSLNNVVFDDFLKKIREKSGTEMVPMKNTLRKIAEHRNRHSLTVLAGDQRPAGNGSLVWMDFMNQQTPVFLGIEKVAKSVNCPVIFCDINVVGRGKYEANFIEITSQPRETQELEITEKYTRLLEKTIKEKPQYWLWSHKRWKIKPQDNK